MQVLKYSVVLQVTNLDCMHSGPRAQKYLTSADLNE